MAHSLELRVPYVDVELGSFARACDDDFKLTADGGKNHYYQHSGAKRVLLTALRDVLPPGTESRPKRGFTLPFRHWMSGSLKGLVAETCHPSVVAERGLIDPKMFAALRAKNNDADLMYPKLWSLMILELWCRQVLDN